MNILGEVLGVNGEAISRVALELLAGLPLRYVEANQANVLPVLLRGQASVVYQVCLQSLREWKKSRGRRARNEGLGITVLVVRM